MKLFLFFGLILNFLFLNAVSAAPQSPITANQVLCELQFKTAALQIINQVQQNGHSQLKNIPLDKLKEVILADQIKVICNPQISQSIKLVKPVSPNEIYIVFSDSAIQASDQVKAFLYLNELLKTLPITDYNLSYIDLIYQNSRPPSAFSPFELAYIIKNIKTLGTKEEGGTSTGVGGIKN